MDGERSENKHIMESLKKRKEELKFFDEIADDIKTNKNKIKSIVVAYEWDSNYVHRAYQGSLTQCYGLTERLRDFINHVMDNGETI